MLRSHHAMRSCVQSSAVVRNHFRSTGSGVSARVSARQLSNSSAPKDSKPPTTPATPARGANSGGGGGGGFLALPLLLLGATVGASYVVEQNESVEQMIQKYEVPFLLDGMDPIRKGLRSIGAGRAQESAPVPESSTEQQPDVDPYAIDEDSGKDLHDEALEELAEDLLAEIGSVEEQQKQVNKYEHSIAPEQVQEAKDLLQNLKHALHREAARTVQKPVSEPEPVPDAQAAPVEESKKVVTTKEKGAEVTRSESATVAVQVDESSVPSSKAKLLEARQNALEEVLGGMAKQTSALRDETERCLVHDLDGLDEKALRYRVAQLTTEFFERIKWEGLRQQQSLQQAEAVLAQKYGDLLSQQENELKLESERKLFELEKNLRHESSAEVEKLHIAQESRVHNALTQQEHELTSKFESDLNKETALLAKNLDEQHTLEVAMMKENHVKQMLETQQAIKATNSEISALTKVVDSEFGKVTVSASTHALAAAVLLAEDALVRSAPAGKAIDALKKLAAPEPLVAAVVNTLPSYAAKKGVPVLDDIKIRFIVVREEARKAALAPEGTNPILSQMIGNFLSFVSIKPTGNVQGDSVEAALSRIDYHLERNELNEALKETQSIRGYPRTLMSDWERMAHDRLVVDQAIRSLKAVSALRHLEIS